MVAVNDAVDDAFMDNDDDRMAMARAEESADVESSRCEFRAQTFTTFLRLEPL